MERFRVSFRSYSNCEGVVLNSIGGNHFDEGDVSSSLLLRKIDLAVMHQINGMEVKSEGGITVNSSLPNDLSER